MAYAVAKFKLDLAVACCRFNLLRAYHAVLHYVNGIVAQCYS